jgi:two-component system phosphate regulon sensor histidine kinase PhoR
MSLHPTLEYEQKLERLRKTMSEREQELETLQRTLSEQEEALDHLKQEVKQREQALGVLQRSLERHDDALVTLQEAAEQEEALETQPATDDNADYKLTLALTLANAAYDALFVLNEQTLIIASNEAAEILFDTPRPVGKMLVDVTELPELEMMVEDAIANEESDLEEQITFQKRFYRVRAQVIRRDGNLFIGLALQDVSELVRLNRARRDMVTNISHELRKPIANIRLIIDGLFYEQEKPKRKQSASALRDVALQIDSLQRLAQELLDLSMIESGEAYLRMVDLSVVDMVDEAIERLEYQSDAKEIELVDQVSKQLHVLADRDQVLRVFSNLIHNAIKWSPPREKIKVRAESSGEEVIISVLDRGPGVPQEYRERIFERFYQIDPSRSGGEGTGLGLAICKHIVEAHGGRIWVEDNPEGKEGRGGNFKFTLPASDIS